MTGNKSEMCVAGVDLALRLTGICLKDSRGFHPALINAAHLRGVARLAYIIAELARLVITAEPVLIALEGYSFESINRPFDLGEVGGIARLLAFDAGISLIIVTPKQLKRFVTGSGVASKQRMVKSVAKFYGVITTSDDEADATGLARLAEIYLTGNSTRRCELEIVSRLKNPKIKQKIQFKKERVHV